MNGNGGRVAKRITAAVEGPQTIGNSREFWIAFATVISVALLYPFVTNPFRLSLMTGFGIWTILALTLTLVWGYAGVFTLAQTAFFGVGGYTFGIVAINSFEMTGATTLAVIAAVVVPMLFAALLGYFIFYGRVTGVYVGIITLLTTLILGLLLARTAGFRVGEANLGGSNGMTGIPNLTLGFGTAVVEFDRLRMYYLVLFLLVGTYLGMRTLVNSQYGYLLIGLREDEDRTEMFGYDIKRAKLAVFAGGAGVAGLTGALFAASGNFTGPDTMGLTAAALPIIWITVGGRETLLGSIIGALGLQYLNQEIAFVGGEFSLIVLGSLVIVILIYTPAGLVPMLATKDSRWRTIPDRLPGVRRDG